MENTPGRRIQPRLPGRMGVKEQVMSELFDTTSENVLMHLKNIFSDRELDETATAKDFLAVQTEGKRKVQRTSSAPSCSCSTCNRKASP